MITKLSDMDEHLTQTENQSSQLQKQQTSHRDIDPNVLINRTSDLVISAMNFGGSAVNLAATIVDAKKQIALAEIQLTGLFANLNSHSNDLEKKSKELNLLHSKLDKMIDAAVQMSLKEGLTDEQISLINMYLTTINNLINTISKLY